MAAIEICANCGEKIGQLETPYLWDERVVCRSCYAKLQPKSGTHMGLLRAITAAAVIIVVVVGAAIWLKRQKPETRAADQPPSAATEVVGSFSEFDIFPTIRQHADASPEQLSGLLSNAFAGRRIIGPPFDWTLDKRSAYAGGLTLTFDNPHGDAAGTDEAVEVLGSHPTYDEFWHTTIVRGRVYSIYDLTIYLKASQTQQAAAIPLGTKSIDFEGKVGFQCFESSGIIHIVVNVMDAEFK